MTKNIIMSMMNTNTFKDNFSNMCGLPSASPSGFIIPLKSKLYYNEINGEILNLLCLSKLILGVFHTKQEKEAVF
jgi:hypothetical protein